MDEDPDDSAKSQVLNNYPILKDIINKCDLPTIASLQKVNRRFREVIGIVNPKFTIHSIAIHIGSKEINLDIYKNQDEQIFPTGSLLNISYQKNGENCCIETLDRDVRNIGRRMEDVFSRDLVSILNFQKFPLESLSIMDTSAKGSGFPLSFLNVVRFLLEEMRWQNRIIKTKELQFTSMTGLGIGSFCKCIAPRILKKYTFINYGPSSANVADFEGMEMQAEKLVEYEQSGVGTLGNVSKISHLNRASLEVERMGHEKLVQLKNEFLRLGPPKDFKILVKHLQPPGNSLGPIFGDKTSGMSWFYRTNFNGKVLRIHISNSEEGSVVEFNFVTILDVTIGAMVQVELLPTEDDK
ncbi:Protein CBG24634 [Caenorhabditis briggsae]|uniref:Protein CBG24634 n=1 Tax=Caenorhabditis briggsae TaxID=6238 RepID=A8WL54_CAEBR|nr:Protein CBG24634 [Caenorhabditis briggsae]CAP21199.1 Protein CBG24634 [Caenorhabditis briggsae]